MTGAAPIRVRPLVAGLVVLLALGLQVARVAPSKLPLLGVGCALGFVLYHAAFGFTGAYRKLIAERDMSGVSAQLVMIAIAMALFAPVLDAGSFLGRGVGGAFAPVSLSMGFGALLFGVGMQVGGGCASGTLFTAGGGSPRMAIVLVFFCAGCFWASLHLDWWQALPDAGAVSLGARYGYGAAVAIQLAALGALYAILRLAGARNASPLWPRKGFGPRAVLRGPWPLGLGALALALLNFATLLLAGHPWSITWAFTLWAAKAAVRLGWDPASSGFWTGGFQQAALERSLLLDTTSVMNFGIVLGALLASALAAHPAGRTRLDGPDLLTAVAGGLMLGYGARLAYGCNIGAFFSGIASTSLHGWVWIACAIVGNVIGVRLRPLLGFERRG